MQLAFAATMISSGRLHDSLIARKLSASEFSHSLGQNQTLPGREKREHFGEIPHSANLTGGGDGFIIFKY